MKRYIITGALALGHVGRAVKTEDRDGYQAVQVGCGTTKHMSKPQKGHAGDLGAFQYMREIRTDDQLERGDTVDVSSFKPGDTVSVTGKSKGRGFQGVVKRHGFHGSPKTHGHKDELRMPGSIGATDAARVFKGTRMAGQMGASQVTVTNLEVVDVDEEKNVLYIKGAIPGARNTVLIIKGDGEMEVKKPAVKEEEKTEEKPTE